ncbi:hypothetical protein E4U43_004326 [Claviceps pusilla]|uniref:Acyltransferase MbtK/IucB-like conserved domain-containing protein n=1 Tax=Claviceps pusilla TaxID=123648 RepID=A0A9P7NG09_9HYPO|nr:hypothetical protein E4U43_004326 [Claviceps pusilla]
MTSQTLHLPDGKKFSVTPVFGGMGFRSPDHNNLHHPFPVGWMTILHTEEEDNVDVENHRQNCSNTDSSSSSSSSDHDFNGNVHPERRSFIGEQDESAPPRPKRRTRPFHSPTLQNDTLFISSISIPSSTDFKPAASPTREIAMMLWITLYWYFHQPEPDHGLDTAACRATPQAARPRGEWKITIKRDGVLRGRNLIPKLERMGLIASEDNSVGTSVDDGGQAWTNMFVSKRMFWQIPAHLFLFTLQPVGKFAGSSLGLYSNPGSPSTSRPDSPREESSSSFKAWHSRTPSGNVPLTPTCGQLVADVPGGPVPTTVSCTPIYPIGPYYSSSHLPTYYPPPPLQYIYTNNIRHPLRPKPPRMGEVFYTRFIESIGQYLSFRVASCSSLPVPYLGPVGPNPPDQHSPLLSSMSDRELLQSWFRNPRVKEFWGDYVPDFLETGLRSKHSFPVIGLWDGIPFGYFEVYWVQEDVLGRHVGSEVDDWDRGVHIMIGEEWSRGRVAAWLTSLVHWCFTSDYRTMNVCLEPRVDNKRVLKHLDKCGFSKEKQVSFPHKQAWFVKLRREFWDGPEL